MKYTKNEILKALTIIKEICDEANDCDICPYGDCMGICQILNNDSPNTWIIKESEGVWRAFD